MTKDYNRLGQFQLEGIHPMPRGQICFAYLNLFEGQPQVEVTFDVD